MQKSTAAEFFVWRSSDLMAKYRRGERKVFILYKSLRNKLGTGGKGGGFGALPTKNFSPPSKMPFFHATGGHLAVFGFSKFLAKQGTYHHHQKCHFFTPLGVTKQFSVFLNF